MNGGPSLKNFELGYKLLKWAFLDESPTGEVGAVAGLRRVKEAAKVALAVLQYSKHTLLVGEAATRFAIEMGFVATDLQTNASLKMWRDWQHRSCQPNFRKVGHDYFTSSGFSWLKFYYLWSVYASKVETADKFAWFIVATSTNGARYKIPGRVGDSPIPGAGGFADNDIGAACATGDGDLMMRLLPSYQAVENMRNGMSPKVAAESAVIRLANKFRSFQGGVIAVNKQGQFGAACHGLSQFGYTVRNSIRLSLPNSTNYSKPG
ncbi:unnamed protein product [Soboliphyme baturini]|uniref:N(4)-(beta-N-acetylglucosaminyl)-L-asparaginase n=1 Tax=Soboliphyme baturini TaxID=241478 RepID=A0A183J4L0_9BILA|nr:unnamed protein product [Soboliphyme baturini]